MKTQNVDRPLIRHKHSHVQVCETSTSRFPELVNQVAVPPGAGTRTSSTLPEEMDAPVIKRKKLCFM